MPNWLLPSIAGLTGALILAMILTASLSFAKAARTVSKTGAVAQQPYGSLLDVLIKITAASAGLLIVLTLVNILVLGASRS